MYVCTCVFARENERERTPSYPHFDSIHGICYVKSVPIPLNEDKSLGCEALSSSPTHHHLFSCTERPSTVEVWWLLTFLSGELCSKSYNPICRGSQCV